MQAFNMCLCEQNLVSCAKTEMQEVNVQVAVRVSLQLWSMLLYNIWIINQACRCHSWLLWHALRIFFLMHKLIGVVSTSAYQHSVFTGWIVDTLSATQTNSVKAYWYAGDGELTGSRWQWFAQSRLRLSLPYREGMLQPSAEAFSGPSAHPRLTLR